VNLDQPGDVLVCVLGTHEPVVWRYVQPVHPLQLYLPWFRMADPETSAQITVRHLLNDTSGLPVLQG
jgi:hypothetical protein